MPDTILENGYKTLIGFELDADVGLEEETVKPPGFDGGGPINTSTMRNDLLESQAPKGLYRITPSNSRCAYKTGSIPKLQNMMNKKQIITYTYPNGAKLAVWGWLDKVEPDENSHGTQPKVRLTIEKSMRDRNGVLTPAVYTPPPA